MCHIVTGNDKGIMDERRGDEAMPAVLCDWEVEQLRADCSCCQTRASLHHYSGAWLMGSSASQPPPHAAARPI